MYEVKKEIIAYVEKKIMPLYELFDKAHNVNHVNRVIDNSFKLASNCDVNINLVYVIASYHDVGLKKDRKSHEKTSAKFLLSDNNLQNWFNQDEIIIMSEAIEDHRASNNHSPRNIYGKIIAEADRDIEYSTILTRALLYSLEKYPSYSFEQHFEQIYEHLKDKYGDNGYLKLYLDFGQNKKHLSELRKNLENKQKIYNDLMEIYNIYN